MSHNRDRRTTARFLAILNRHLASTTLDLTWRLVRDRLGELGLLHPRVLWLDSNRTHVLVVHNFLDGHDGSIG